jgi:ribosomal protein L22
MKLEDKGNYRAAINLYELVIRKYEDSPEYYVAMARLPYLYSMLEEDNNILIAAYDEAYKSENTTNKKFFKGMKVAAHIKGKRYDDAIIVAEEMKNEAEFEEEIILADINIAIANKLKNLNSKGKSKNAADDIQTLISKLTGNGEKNEPADISKTLLPEKTVLHQNYPNPFNPVTQIKFDLAKTCNVKLNIYNVSGQKIAELADGIRNAGFHTVEFDGSKFNSGIYYYTLEVDGKNITKKMVLTK